LQGIQSTTHEYILTSKFYYVSFADVLRYGYQMGAAPPPISLRLPQATREKLDKAAVVLRRSRSFVIQEALERHLDDMIHESGLVADKRRLDTLLSLAGAGGHADHPRSADDVGNYTNWLRGNE
jgi:predicted DNA-binding protein